LILHPALIYSVIIYSLAVGATIFITTILDMGHPPAAGSALGVAMTGLSIDILITVTISAILLSLIHNILKRHIKELT